MKKMTQAEIDAKKAEIQKELDELNHKLRTVLYKNDREYARDNESARRLFQELLDVGKPKPYIPNLYTNKKRW
jgi:hypothetical protein